MNQARLTSTIRDTRTTIATMEFGRAYWVVPWAMWASRDELLWLHPDYQVHDEPGGTVRMRVELHPDGYHAWPPPGALYLAQDTAGYVGGMSQPFIPVAAIGEPW